MSQITAEQVPQAALDILQTKCVTDRVILAAILNDPAIRRLVVTACVEEATETLGGLRLVRHKVNDVQYVSMAPESMFAALCPPEAP